MPALRSCQTPPFARLLVTDGLETGTGAEVIIIDDRYILSQTVGSTPDGVPLRGVDSVAGEPTKA